MGVGCNHTTTKLAKGVKCGKAQNKKGYHKHKVYKQASKHKHANKDDPNPLMWAKVYRQQLEKYMFVSHTKHTQWKINESTSFTIDNMYYANLRI